MPFVRITLYGAVDAEQIRRLQQCTTDLMIAVMRKPRASTAVLVEQVERGGWSIAGEAVGVAAHVEAIIGADTTTSLEKERFLAEMWTLLRATLGPRLRQETYVVCHEVAADAYGRGGLTRAARDHRRAAAG